MTKRPRNPPVAGSAWPRPPSPELAAALVAKYGPGCRLKSVPPELEAAALCIYDDDYFTPEGYMRHVFEERDYWRHRRSPVVDFSKYPDFRGQWDRNGPPNNWVVLSGPPPLTPEYQKVFDASKADQKSGRPGNWPSTFCMPEGMPAMMNVYNPLESLSRGDDLHLTSHNKNIAQLRAGGPFAHRPAGWDESGRKRAARRFTCRFAS